MQTKSRIAAVSATTVVIVATIWLVILEYVRHTQFALLEPRGQNGRLQYLIDSPLVLTGVVANMQDLGWAHHSSKYGEVQLSRSRIKVEHVLKGPTIEREINVYWFRAKGSNGGLKRMEITPGVLAIFYLRQQAGEWRTACDVYAHCFTPIFTGRHPLFRGNPNEPIGDQIIQLLFLRGTAWISDGTMVDALSGNAIEPYRSYAEEWRYEKPQAYLDILQQTARTETPPVRAEACELLAKLGKPCQPCYSNQEKTQEENK